MFITVGMPSSRLTGPTCRIAGCMSGANMNTIPASRSALSITGSGTSIDTFSASSTSALPQSEVNDRLPCFAIRTPVPAASSAAAVEMLNVTRPPPPVPHVSTSSSGRSARSTTMTFRRARTIAASSSGLSPRTRSPMRIAATCAAVASPAMMLSNARVSSSFGIGSPWASRRIAVVSALGSADTEHLVQTLRQARARRDERDHQPEQPHAFHVFLAEYAVHGAIGEVYHANEILVIDERKADERSSREVLVAQQRMLLGFAHVAHEKRLS